MDIMLIQLSKICGGRLTSSSSALTFEFGTTGVPLRLIDSLAKGRSILSPFMDVKDMDGFVSLAESLGEGKGVYYKRCQGSDAGVSASVK